MPTNCLNALQKNRCLSTLTSPLKIARVPSEPKRARRTSRLKCNLAGPISPSENATVLSAQAGSTPPSGIAVTLLKNRNTRNRRRCVLHGSATAKPRVRGVKSARGGRDPDSLSLFRGRRGGGGYPPAQPQSMLPLARLARSIDAKSARLIIAIAGGIGAWKLSRSALTNDCGTLITRELPKRFHILRSCLMLSRRENPINPATQRRPLAQPGH